LLERPLALALAGLGFFVFAGVGVASGAAHTPLEQLGHLVLFAQGFAATAAQAQATGLQAMADGHALIEHKALPLPAALFWRDVRQVLKNAPLQMEHLVKAHVAQQGGGFFTADAPGAKHRHFGF
jgi:hypothetical protein